MQEQDKAMLKSMQTRYSMQEKAYGIKRQMLKMRNKIFLGATDITLKH